MSEETGTSWSERVLGGFRKTSDRLSQNLAGLSGGEAKLDDATLDNVEDALIVSDLGPAAASRIRARLSEKRFGLRHLSGIRAAESGDRERFRRAHGQSTDRTCAPLIDWSAADVFAYLEGASIKDYYVASAAEGIFVHPAGELSVLGLSATQIYFKGALDKLGVKVDDTWLETARSAEKHSRTAKSKAVAQAQATVDTISAMDLSQGGFALIDSWANGILSAKPIAEAAAASVAAGVAANLEGQSPPKEGPLRSIDTWGPRSGKNSVTPSTSCP